MFQYNYAETGYGGAIFMRDQATCVNIESLYVGNSASEGGAIYCRYDVELVNTASRFINNTGTESCAGRETKFLS